MALWALFIMGCPGTPTAEAPQPIPRRIDAAAPQTQSIGRAGPVEMDLEGLRDAVCEARVLQHWRSGRAPDPKALESGMLRRRVLTKAMETRLVRLEIARRGLTLPPGELDALLRRAAAGLPPGRGGSPEAPGDLGAALSARYGAEAARVERVARDLIEARLLTEALLNGVGEAQLKRQWTRRETLVVLDLVRVPRVPSSAEIDAAVKARKAQITRRYERARVRFVQPPRRQVSRFFAKAKAEAHAARGAIAAGADFASRARAESKGPNARRGGVMGALSQAQLPAAFEVALGELTPLLKERGGWAFYRVERETPALERKLDDPRVQRELAAELLREADALPEARRTAGQARLLLASGDEAGLAKLVAEARLRRHTSKAFHQDGRPSVPGLGLAPELHAAAFELSPAKPVTGIFTVRQAYVVARLLSRSEADPAAWPAAREAFTKAWKARERGVAIETWLGHRLEKQPMWVDMKRLRGLSLEALGL